MALQGSGRKSFSDIRNEFGTPRDNNIGAYRVSETYGAMSNLPLDNGIPQSGRINWSDFYNKRLNLIIDCYSGGGSPTSTASFFWNSLMLHILDMQNHISKLLIMEDLMEMGVG